MGRHKVIINASTGKATRVDLTQAEEQQRDDEIAAWTIKKKAREDAAQKAIEDKAALQQKLRLSDAEMEILGKVGNIK